MASRFAISLALGFRECFVLEFLRDIAGLGVLDIDIVSSAPLFWRMHLPSSLAKQVPPSFSGGARISIGLPC